MAFYLGKPVGAMVSLALVCGAVIAMRPSHSQRADLTVWVFAESHAKTYAGEDMAGGTGTLVDQFLAATGTSVSVELVPSRSEDVRLVSKFMSGSSDVPDLVEVEIGSVGKYFRPPLREVGFLPLNDYLKKSGYMEKIVPARFAPWTKEGLIFGVPHDVHPVSIIYREDLFREAGIDLPAQKSWHDFRAACVRFQDYWRARGVVNRHAMEMNNGSADHLMVLLLQRHLNVVDADGRLHMAEHKFAETMAFYAQCVAGGMNIAGQSNGGAGGLARDIAEGNLCAFFTPDWRVEQIKRFAPGVSGKMRMMALPVFEAGDARTATWGGTMMGIPRNCRNPEAAWKLMELLYFSKEGMAARRKYTDILPPVTTLWEDEVYHRPDPFFGGQSIGAVYVELAREIPARYVTPATNLAGAALSKVLQDAAVFINDGRGDHAALVKACEGWLGEMAVDIERRIAHGKFDE